MRFTDTWTTVPVAPPDSQGRAARCGWDQRPYIGPIYSGLVTDLEREYSPSSRVGGSAAPFIEGYEQRSAAAGRALGDRVRTLPGGTRFVSAGERAPLLVFVHGGYWQALSAEASLYLAPGALALGWSYACLDYTVAPQGNLASMVRECATGLIDLALLDDHEHVVLAGHSAGAHLAAMASIVHSPSIPVDRVVLMSGIFDLRPLVLTTVNEPLGLDDAAAAALSPALLPVVGRSPAMVAWGDNETDAFKAQGHLYAARLRANGVAVAEHECPGRHHFDIVDDLVDPSTALGAFVTQWV